MLLDACLLPEPEERMNVEEQMIPYKGKTAFNNIFHRNLRNGASKL